MTLNSPQPLDVKEVWGPCLLQLNDSYRNSICVQSEFHLLKMPRMFSKVKKKNSDSLLGTFLLYLDNPLFS